MIISIGEVVWDMFGDKKVLGGKPTFYQQGSSN